MANACPSPASRHAKAASGIEESFHPRLGFVFPSAAVEQSSVTTSAICMYVLCPYTLLSYTESKEQGYLDTLT